MSETTATTTRKVLVSPGFGAGWMTWADDKFAEDFLFDPELIAAVERGDDLGDADEPGTPLALFVERLVAKHGEDARFEYLGGARDLVVEEVDGPFIVDEYDGSESIVLRNETRWY